MAGNFWTSSHCKQWIWDPQELDINRRHDVERMGSIANYHKLMTLFINLIQEIGEKLKIRQQVIATATVYFKRFYSKYGLESADPILMAPTCIQLAAKVEESGAINTNKIINSSTNALKNKFTCFNCEFQHKFQLGSAEFYLLELMDCCLIVYQPYRPLLQYVEDFGHKDKVLQLAWRICNDLLRTDVPLLYAPHQQALAALYMAASSLDIDCRQWFVELSVSLEPIIKIINELMLYYSIMKSVKEKEFEKSKEASWFWVLRR